MKTLPFSEKFRDSAGGLILTCPPSLERLHALYAVAGVKVTPQQFHEGQWTIKLEAHGQTMIAGYADAELQAANLSYASVRNAVMNAAVLLYQMRLNVLLRGAFEAADEPADDNNSVVVKP